MIEIDEILNKPSAEIDAMAKERGLTPSDYPNIEELAKAIFYRIPILEKPIVEEKKVEEPEGKTPEDEKPEEKKPDEYEGETPEDKKPDAEEVAVTEAGK